MDFLIKINTIRMELSIIYFKGHRSAFPNKDAFWSLRIVFTLSSSVETEKISSGSSWFVKAPC